MFENNFKKSSEPLVSVVVAAYNAGQFLSHAIETVLVQTYNNLEIIIIDDGSTDNTKEVVASFNDDRIRYLFQDNQGQAIAKNKGVQEARGSLIAFLDADDMWSPTKLEAQIPVFDQSDQIGVVYTNVEHIDKYGNSVGIPQRNYHSGKITDKLLIDNFVTGMASIVRRECFEKVGLFDESLPMGIDYDLWLRISVYYDFCFLDVITYYYRQWDGQMSQNFKIRFDCAFRIMEKFQKNNPEMLKLSVIKKAYSYTYTSLGQCHYEIANEPRLALNNYIKAFRYDPCSLRTWKNMVKLLLGIKRLH